MCAEARAPGGTKHDRLEAVFHTAVATAEGARRAAVADLALTVTHDLDPCAVRLTRVAVCLAVGAAYGRVDGRADFGLAARFTRLAARGERWCADRQANTVAAKVANGTAPGSGGLGGVLSCICQAEYSLEKANK